MLHILNFVYPAVDSKWAALLVALYISAAFDTISHNLLLSRLESDYGVRPKVMKWIQLYVMDRKQFVKLGRHTSATSPHTGGVPQGSVLGPLLSRPNWVVLHRLPPVCRPHPALHCSDHSGLSRFDLHHRLFWRHATLVPRERFAAQQLQVWIGRYRHCRPAEVHYRSLYICDSITIAGPSLPISREVKSLGVMLTVSCGSTVTAERSPRCAPTTRTLCVMCATCWRLNSPRQLRAVSSRHRSITAILYCTVHQQRRLIHFSVLKTFLLMW